MHTICYTSGNNFKFSFILIIISFSVNICATGEVEEEAIVYHEDSGNKTNPHWFSFAHSPTNLFHLAAVEKELYRIVQEYIAKLDNEPELFLRRFVADYEGSSLKAYENVNEDSNKEGQGVIHTNPLLAHRMIWRFVKDFPKIKKVLLASGITEILSVKLEKTLWPSEADLEGSIHNLLTLHFVYNLNISEFAEGNISGVITNTNLAGVQCFEIAEFALRSKQYTRAYEWLKVADTKRLVSNSHPILDFLPKQAISKLLEEIIQKHDASWEINKFENFDHYYDKMDSKYVLTTKLSLFQKKNTTKGDGRSFLTLTDFLAFSALCKGRNLQSEKAKSKLYCWYESKIHPTFYINPQKMELHSEDPYIFQVYDFIGNEFIDYLKEESIPEMELSKVAHEGNEDFADDLSYDERFEKAESGKYSQIRTSMYSWLEEDDYNIKLKHLSKNIGYITGLSASFGSLLASSTVQVAAYSTGGYFNIHYDSLEKAEIMQYLIEDNVGNRLATFMIYLNNVELGGHTAFTSVGVGIVPVKGSALFWYDLKQNGETDYRTWHGGCPVLLGEKWVANKWIHDYPNILKRKCTLNKDE